MQHFWYNKLKFLSVKGHGKYYQISSVPARVIIITKGLENIHPPRRKNISYNLRGGEFITNRYQLYEIYIAAK